MCTDIEELTGKTGNFKRFAVFARMVHSAVTQASDSVTLDLLTPSDLEALRAKRAGRQGSAAAPEGSSVSFDPHKRYLIVTYVAEYDRVHYPLPLSEEPLPAPADMARELRRLRGLVDAKAGAGAAAALVRVEALDRENAVLRKEIRQAKELLSREAAPGGLTRGEEEDDELQRLREANKRAEANLARVRDEASKEIAAIRRQCAVLQRSEAAGDTAAASESRALRQRCAALEAENGALREAQAREARRNARDKQRLAADLDRAKDQERALRLNIETR